MALAKNAAQRSASVQAFVQAFLEACKLPSYPSLPTEKSVRDQSILDKKMPPDQSSRQKGDRGQPPQHSVVQTPRIIQDERVVSQPTPPHVTPVGRADQSPLQTPAVIQQSHIRDALPVPPPPIVSASTRERVPPDVLVSNRHITRRTMLFLGLAGAGVTVTGISLWTFSHRSPSNSGATSSESTYTWLFSTLSVLGCFKQGLLLSRFFSSLSWRQSTELVSER